MFGLFSGFKRKHSETESESETESKPIKKIKLIPKYDCIIYTRISSAQQNSLQQQEQSCREFLLNKNYNIIDVVQEASSARHIKNLKNLKKIIHNNKNITIVVYSIDRFCRNTIDGINILKTLVKKNIKLLAVQDNIDFTTAAGRHAFRQRLSAAELESDLISERVQRVINFKKQHNHYFGKAKFGYSLQTQIIDGMKINTLIENQEEQKIYKFIDYIIHKRVTITYLTKELSKISEIIDKLEIYENDILIADNDRIYLTTKSIVNILNDYNILNRGKQWTSSHIQNIRQNFYNNIEQINIY